MSAQDHIPVLIVGGGPSGLLLAYLLSQLGVKSIIVERYLQRLSAPKAHALSPRSLEICRQFGLDSNHIRTIGSQRRDAYWVNFITTLNGEHVGRLPYERMDTDVLDATPEMIHNIPQPQFEELIANALAGSDLVEIRKGASFVSYDQDDNGVVTVIEERATGKHYGIRSRHVVACDGAKSGVRAALQIESEGEDGYETMMTIEFNADLRSVIKDNVGILHWVMDPEVSGFIIGYDLSKKQVLICNFDPKKHAVETWNEELCRKTLDAAIGTNIPYDVLSFRPWVLSRKVAKSYRIGNVFLAGDAAHSFPPTGGLGLNSGIADVHNLAYKIAAVHLGWATDSSLDNYEKERRHVAEVNSQQSVRNGKKIFSLLRSLGASGIDTAEARKNLFDTIHNPQLRKEVDAQIKDQQEHFDNLELHIGYVYGDKSFPSNASDYAPKYVPGARLPHVWMTPLTPSVVQGVIPSDLSYIDEFSVAEKESRRYSTLDLCPFHCFMFILGPGHMARERICAVRALLQTSSTRGIAKESHKKLVAPDLRSVQLGEDFRLRPSAGADEFIAMFGLADGQAGGVLVRPDQHILLVLSKDTSAKEIAEAIRDHLTN